MVPPELFPLQSIQPLTETLLVLVATVLSGVAIWYPNTPRPSSWRR